MLPKYYQTFVYFSYKKKKKWAIYFFLLRVCSLRLAWSDFSNFWSSLVRMFLTFYFFLSDFSYLIADLYVFGFTSHKSTTKLVGSNTFGSGSVLVASHSNAEFKLVYLQNRKSPKISTNVAVRVSPSLKIPNSTKLFLSKGHPDSIFTSINTL